MDLTVRKSDLFRQLQYVQGVVERKTTVPILSNLLLETRGNSLLVTATDLDVTIQCGCPADVKTSGSLTVSARKLFDIVRLLPESEMHFRLADQEWIRISCERSRFKIASLPKDNFPDIPAVGGEPVKLDGSALRYMITRCVFAITQEESRFALSGALMILRPGSLTFVTTDGHRLALISREIETSGVEGEMRNLVPRKTLVELAKLASDGDGEVEFGKSENHLFFKTGESLLISRLLSGQFPNYDMVIPADNDKTVTLNTLGFSDALRRVAVMADEQSKAVRFGLSEGSLDISSNNADFGEAKETVPVQYKGQPLSICFNALYLLDFLGGVESDEVLLMLKDEETQGLLKPGMGGDYTYHYVVMPMKL